MAQRQDQIDSGVHGTRTWIPVLLLISVLLLLIPGIPVSVTVAAVSIVVILLAFLVRQEDGGQGGGT